VRINVSGTNSVKRSFIENMETANELTHGFETQILKNEEDNIYNIVDHQRNKKGNSYIQVFRVAELNFLLLSAALTQTSCYITYDVCSTFNP
jgi:hypothetical protein